jgi:ribonuclease P protein component
MLRLKQRADFVAAAAGARISRRGFVLQCRRRDDAADTSLAPRVGFTVTRKAGSAVERNRIRRRLREVVRLTAADWISPGHDYVVVGRREALTLGFAELRQDLASAGTRITSERRGRSGPQSQSRS